MTAHFHVTLSDEANAGVERARREAEEKPHRLDDVLSEMRQTFRALSDSGKLFASVVPVRAPQAQ